MHRSISPRSAIGATLRLIRQLLEVSVGYWAFSIKKLSEPLQAGEQI